MNAIAANAAYGAQHALYGAAQFARVLWFTGHYIAGRRRMGPLTRPGEAPYADEFPPLDRARLKDSFRELFRRDWDNIRTGQYRLPAEMRRAPSFARLWRASRDYLKDADLVARRRHGRIHSEVASPELSARYPRYYLQNFHYQSDGWMSAGSAERYEMQVETLFTGAAQAMRRQALPFIGRAIAARDAASVALLDLGCGTGSFLAAVKDNWPDLNATALDLSPAYLGKARASLAKYPNMRFVEVAAETTGLASASFDVVTAIYLFHELPPAVRRKVAREMARLAKPGATLIVADTIQYGDEPGFDILLENFPRAFHEPYFDSFCRDDLGVLFGEAGFVKDEESVAFLTKISVFAKR